MFDSQVLAFTLVVAALAFTPGADTMLVVKNGIRSGSPAGWATTFGILGGTLLHAMISALGLSMVLALSNSLSIHQAAWGSLPSLVGSAGTPPASGTTDR